MLFFKPRHKQIGILPPPHPDSELELEEPSLLEESRTTPVLHSTLPKNQKFFDEILTQNKPESFPEESEFKDLVEKVFQKTRAKKQQPKSKAPKKPEPRQLKKIPKPKQAKKEIRELPESVGDFEFPNDFVEPFGGLKGKASQKPAEILEAEHEIESAIESIKKQENPSFLKKLFAKKTWAGKKSWIPNQDKVSLVQENIRKARDAMMESDLESAKASYLETIRIYNQLKPQEQARVYHDINDLYSERKSAEKLKT